MASPPRPDKDLLTAWILLLLGRAPTHGYRLRQELEAQSLAVDPSAMYRALRELESAGAVRSRWTASSTGPRRRLYRLTPKGRERLDAITAAIVALHERHDSFLRAYDKEIEPDP